MSVESDQCRAWLSVVKRLLGMGHQVGVIERRNRMNSLVLQDDDGIRPAGNPDECFYCHQKVGTPHKNDCVILNRKVKVRYTFEIEIEQPHSWDKQQIERHRNNGSWCADNAVSELDNYPGSCLCPVFHCEVLEIPDVPPFRKNKAGEVVP